MVAFFAFREYIIVALLRAAVIFATEYLDGSYRNLLVGVDEQWLRSSTEPLQMVYLSRGILNTRLETGKCRRVRSTVLQHRFLSLVDKGASGISTTSSSSLKRFICHLTKRERLVPLSFLKMDNTEVRWNRTSISENMVLTLTKTASAGFINAYTCRLQRCLYILPDGRYFLRLHAHVGFMNLTLTASRTFRWHSVRRKLPTKITRVERFPLYSFLNSNCLMRVLVWQIMLLLSKPSCTSKRVVE